MDKGMGDATAAAADNHTDMFWIKKLT
jgi:hypothetical protein